MARDKNDASNEPEPQPDMNALILHALQNMPVQDLQSLLSKAGVTPTTQGLTTENLQVIMGSMTAASADAFKQTMRGQRKENPNYPEKSVFFPAGRFDDDGHPLAPKVTFTRRTYHNHILLGGELETEEEIRLFNSITTDRTARDGKWKFEVLDKGTSRERVMLTTPSMTPDERSDNSLPLPMILMELIGGPEAVNAGTMAKQIAELQAQIKAMQPVGAPA